MLQLLEAHWHMFQLAGDHRQAQLHTTQAVPHMLVMLNFTVQFIGQN